jgi:two-component system cell cycle sensor histidine kinase/response regulator CckA
VDPDANRATAILFRESDTRPVSPTARVLVVDDEELVATALRRLLRGQQVTVSRSGAEAVELFCQGAYDLMFCDLMMPGYSGLDVWLSVRERSPGLEKRIVFMSGGAFTAHAEGFIADHECSCVEKPFDLQAVWAHVRRLCAASH